LIPLAEAYAQLIRAAQPLTTEKEQVALFRAHGRVLAQTVCLDRDEPPVRRSAMDGFAVLSADGVTERVIRGAVYAGTADAPKILPGEAVAVMTGGTVAEGADSVIPVELCKVAGELLQVQSAPVRDQHIRCAGEIGAQGSPVVPAGRRLASASLAAAASCGVDPVQVYSRPRATVISTGDEVVAWSEQPQAHEVRDANRLATALQLEEAGAEVLATRRVADQPAELKRAVVGALAAGDVVVTIGGVSMGDKDHLPRIFAEIGAECLFHGLAVQPGKPVWVGRRGSQWIVGLPGNPVSAWVMAELLLRPLVRALAHHVEAEQLPLQACLVGAALRTRGRERFFPARIEANKQGLAQVTPLFGRGSGDWTVLADAEVLLRVPAHTELQVGDRAHYLRLAR